MTSGLTVGTIVAGFLAGTITFAYWLFAGAIIVDGPFCANNKCFRNFSGGYAGPQTMRWGLEQSRNLMTVRTASQVGMEPIVETIKTMGIGTHEPYLSTALGAGTTTVEKLVNAYAMLANHGRALKPREALAHDGTWHTQSLGRGHDRGRLTLPDLRQVLQGLRQGIAIPDDLAFGLLHR